MYFSFGEREKSIYHVICKKTNAALPVSLLVRQSVGDANGIHGNVDNIARVVGRGGLLVMTYLKVLLKVFDCDDSRHQQILAC